MDAERFAFKRRQTLREGTGACFFVAVLFLGIAAYGLSYTETEGGKIDIDWWGGTIIGPITIGLAAISAALGTSFALQLKEMRGILDR